MRAVTTLPGGRLAVVEGELLDLDRRCKHGDPVAGWRGDETLHIFVRGPFVEVCGIDINGDPYIATVVDARTPGWKHEALARLVRGDWQRGDAWARIEASNRTNERTRQAAVDERLEEATEKLAWGIARDHGDRSFTFIGGD